MPLINYYLHSKAKQLAFFKSALFALFFLTVSSGHALIYAPVSGLRMQSAGNLSTALDLGRPGVSTRFQAGSAESGGNAFAVRGAFPILGSETARVAGWSFGLAGGISETSLVPGRIFWPGIYYWELSLGRGTTFPMFEKGSGLRGFMEVAFREERLRGSPLNNEALNDLNIRFPDKAFSTSIRMGAHSDLSGNGIVQQKEARPGFRLQSSINFSHSDQPFYLAFDGRLQWRCHGSTVGCGVSGVYLFAVQNQFDKSSAELRHFISLGPTISAVIAKTYYVDLSVAWTYTKGLRQDTPQTVTSKLPSVQANFSIPF